MRAATPLKGRQRSAMRSSLSASGRRFRFRASLAASCSATSPAGKASGWPRQNRRKTSAVHGPIAFDRDERLMRVLGVEGAEADKVKAILHDRLGEGPQGSDFGVRQPAGAQVLLRRLRDLGRLKRRDARLQSAENRAGAGRRHLLRHDDRGHSGKPGLPAAKRRRAADRNQPPDELRVFGAQTLGRLKEPRLIGDWGTGMVDPCLGWTAFGAPGCSDRRLRYSLCPHGR